MAKYVKPLPDFDKVFEIYCKNKDKIKEFEDNNEIWGHEPFQDYIEHFDDTYGYWITYSIYNGFFGCRTYYYTVHICKI